MKKFGLIGKTLGHSFSRTFFTDFFAQENIDASYSNIELSSIDEVDKVLSGNYLGLNVTIPYKESIIPFLDELSDEAREIGAVNVVTFERGRHIGFNTDAYGFHQSIKPFLTNRHERAIVFGTGGASKAVAFALRSIGVDVIFVSRNPVGENHFSYDEVNEHMLRACKLLVNTTPVGTFPNIDECIHIPFEYLSDEHLVVDLIYNPAMTKFLQMAQQNGATILNGESMLKQQALKAWKIWNKNV
ncbi:MAG: shikimate dehydrogenase [Crocinitomicaceae bacterium]|nr:shikimate dehydrogenase [Crocinitomicaceae bacterium]